MKLLIVLSLIAYGYGDKLDRTYLPPASAGTAGGGPGSLTAPRQETGFGQQTPGFQGNQAQPGQFGPQSGVSQPSGLSFGQNRPNQAPGFGQPLIPNILNKIAPSSVGFGRSGLGGNQVTNLHQLSGTGVPSRGSFDQSQFNPNLAGQNQRNQGFSGQSQQPERPQAAGERASEILRYDNQINGDSFGYEFETSNGILAEESGVASNGVQAQGEFSYTGDDGQFYKVTYTADENGYLAQGEHLPTPPPIPEEILRSIEENARAAAIGVQEGAYNPAEDNSPQQLNSGFEPGQNQFRGSNGFSPSGSGGNQGKTQGPRYQGSNQATTQQAFNNQGGNQQGFSGQTRQGQNGSQGQGQSGYDYSRPQNQGRGNQPSGNRNFIPTSFTKTLGSRNQGRPFQGQNQPTPAGSFEQSRSNQGQYKTPEFNQPQDKPSGNSESVYTGNNFNRGPQGASRNEPLANQGSGSTFNQNRLFTPSVPQNNQGPPVFGQNRPNQNQQQPQFGSQGQIGSQTSQGRRGQAGPQNQDGYEYKKPQATFNSGNQGQFRPQTQGTTGSGSQGNFNGPQSQTRFPSNSGSRPGLNQGAFPGSIGTSRPSGPRGQQGFLGSGSPQYEQGAQTPTSQMSNNPLANQRQETFSGPRQQPSFSPEEGYKY